MTDLQSQGVQVQLLHWTCSQSQVLGGTSLLRFNLQLTLFTLIASCFISINSSRLITILHNWNISTTNRSWRGDGIGWTDPTRPSCRSSRSTPGSARRPRSSRSSSTAWRRCNQAMKITKKNQFHYLLMCRFFSMFVQNMGLCKCLQLYLDSFRRTSHDLVACGKLTDQA